MRVSHRQVAFAFRTWGGRRPGAGRKPAGPTAGVPHRRRAVHCARHPVHVTMRAVPGLPSLRSDRLFPALRHSLAVASGARFRIVQFSVQVNHVHLLLEGDDGRSLARGMQGLGIRLAKSIPREVRHGLAYVLLNGRKHGAIHAGIDPCSSGPWFPGWREAPEPARDAAPVAQPRTWLLRVGWRRSGLIGVDQALALRRRNSLGPRARTRTRSPSTGRRSIAASEGCDDAD